VDGWDALAAQRLGRELELLDERRALAREEEAWRREEVRRLDGLAAQQWARAQAAGLDLPEPERSPAGGGLAWVARVVPRPGGPGGGDASRREAAGLPAAVERGGDDGTGDPGKGFGTVGLG